MNRVFVLIRYNRYPSNYDYWIPIVSKDEKDLWNWIEEEYNHIISKIDPKILMVNIERFSFYVFTYPGGMNNSSISIKYEIVRTNMVGEEDE